MRRFALLTLLSCQPFFDSSEDVNAVLLITVGGMNAEQVNAGTPHLHTLARSGQYWPRAYAASPMTLPSLATLHTGRNPPQHGVRDAASHRLDDAEQTLAEILSVRGWQTQAYVGTALGAPRWGLDQGFQAYTLGAQLDDLRVGSIGAQELARAVVNGPTTTGSSLVWVDLPDLRQVEPDSLNHALALQEVDHAIGLLTTHWWNAHPEGLVVVAGDRGRSAAHLSTEAFLLEDETLRVPMIIAGSDLGPRVHEGVFGLADLLPTLMPLIGIQPLPQETGVNRLGEPDPTPAYSETIAPWTRLGRAPLFALTTAQERYVEGLWGSVHHPASRGFSFIDQPHDRTGSGPSNHPLASTLREFTEPDLMRIAPAVTLDRDALDRIISEGTIPGDLGTIQALKDVRDEPILLDLIDQARVSLAHRTPTLIRDLHRLESTLGPAWEVTFLSYLYERDRPERDTAVRLLEEYETWSPSSTVSMWLGDLHTRAGDPVQARHAYLNALQQDPWSGDALSSALMAEQEYSPLSFGVSPDAHSAAVAEAMLFASWAPELGRPSSREASALRPEHLLSQLLTARLDFEVAPSPDRLEHTLELLDLAPNHTPLRLLAAEMHLELGDPARAARLLAPVRAALPDDPTIRELQRRAIEGLPKRSPQQRPHHVWRP